MSTPRHDDPGRHTERDTERDAWLSEALRHAPDARAAPPSALSDSILRQARAATNAARPPAAATARGPWAAAWHWLARPPVAAGFASVMVATLIGLMWWDQPMDPSLARPSAADASPAPAAPQQPAAATPQQPAAAPTEISQDTAKAGAESIGPAAPARQRKDDAAPKAAARRAETAPAGTLSSAPAPAPAPAPRVAPEREVPAPFVDRRSAADAVAAPPAAAPAAEPVVAPPPSPATSPAPSLADSPAATALRARASAPPAAAKDKLEAARDPSRALTLSGALAPGAGAPAALGELLSSVAAQPGRWTWERNGTPQPMTQALQRWLARLDTVTATARWQSAAEPAASGETALLRLYRDGELTATLRLDDASVGLVPGPRATLAPATLATLKRALDDATR